MINQIIGFVSGNGWMPGLFWSYALSEALVIPVYYSIAFALAYSVWRHKNLKFRWVYLMLGAFILASGTAHLLSIVLLRQPLYPLDAHIKAIAAVIAITTAIYLVRIISQALRLRTQEELEKKIKDCHLALQEKDYKLQTLSEQFAALIETIPDALFIKDGEDRLVIANEVAKQLFKLHDIAWQGKTGKELPAICPELHGMCEQCFTNDNSTWNERNALVSENDFTMEDEAGNHREFSVLKALFFRENGERKGMVVMGRDKTDFRLAEQELRIADIAIESQEGIIITDRDQRILRVNRAFTRLTGYSAEEVIGKTPAILKSGCHNEAFYQAMWEKLRLEKTWQGEVWDRRKSGDIYPKWLTINAVVDPVGRVSHYVGSFSDLSEHKDAQAAIHRLAFYDPLTDLPNRRLFNNQLDLAMSVSVCNQHYAAIMMIDLDNFKAINDAQGHAMGDQLLAEVAQRLKSCVRQGDTLARLGGDEFVIILENLDKEDSQAATQAQAVGEKILNALNQPYLLNGDKHYTSASIGISLFINYDVTREEILKRADAAMYQAKSAGRNTLRLFDPDMQASLESRMTLEIELRHALAQNQFQLHYQIQVDNSGEIIGAEALLRWKHPQQGLMTPDRFIPLAEESGLILPIGDWVLRTACLQLKAWADNSATKDLQLAVNVSAYQFSQPGFVNQLCKILIETGANATRLKLELTESLLMHNITDTSEKMEALKPLGIRFSMDDFGTGYSSLRYLKTLPITQLKIDQSFVRDIIIDPSDATIVKTIISMADNLGLNVIAEGVETEEQRACLERLGCFAYQGYLFSKPVPLAEFEALLSLAWTQTRSIQDLLKSARS
ncbi:EAL domain-containing protein [Methylobacter sp.]|uniref:EAL domain-containing protein n=1 Tax=Methylobacter sp. TaxID=2051955 RepID=UPI002FDF0061